MAPVFFVPFARPVVGRPPGHYNVGFFTWQQPNVGAPEMRAPAW